MLDTNETELREALKELGKGTHDVDTIEAKILEMRTEKTKKGKRKNGRKK